MALLSVHNLSVRFGAVTAVDDVSFTLEPRTLTGLIGPNGAGKTTVLDACTGFVPAQGEVRLGDAAISDLSAHQRARRGLVRTFQSLDLLADLTVAENVASGLAARRHDRGGVRRLLRRENGTSDPVVAEALELVDLTDVAAALPGELSQGRRALVALARALVGEPTVLLLDEPAAGLDTHESERLGATLTALVERTGVACVLVEHDMGLVMSTCHDVLVLDNGRLLAHGTPAQVKADPTVLDAYLGAVVSQETVCQETGSVMGT